MASDQDIIRNIILRIEEQVVNAGAAQRHLGQMSTRLNAAQKQMGNFNVGIGKTSKSLEGFFAKGKMIGKGLHAMLGPIGLVTGAIALLLDTFKAVGDFFGGFGQQFTEFGAITGRGAVAVQNMVAGYDQMTATAKRTAISISQLTEAMSGFAQQTVSSLLMAGEQGTGEFIGGLQQDLAIGMGSMESAKKLTQDLTTAMMQLGPRGARQMRADMIAAGDDIQAKMEVLSRLTIIDPHAATAAIGALSDVEDATTTPAKAWQALTGAMSAGLNKIKFALLSAFGGDFTTVADRAAAWFDTLVEKIKKAKEWFITIKVHAFNAFKDIITILAPVIKVWTGFNMLLAEGGKTLGKWVGALLPGLGEAMEATSENIQSAMLKIEDGLDAISGMEKMDLKEQIANAQKEAEQLGNAAGKIPPAFKQTLLLVMQAVEQIKVFEQGASDSLSSFQSLVTVLAKLGPAFEKLYGKHVGQALKIGLQQAVNLIKESKTALETVSKSMKDLQSQRLFATTPDELKTIDEQLAKLSAEHAKAAKGLESGYAAVKSIRDANLEPERKLLDLAQAQTDEYRKHISLSQAIVGVPGLGVAAIARANVKLNEQRKILEGMLSKHDATVAQMKAEGVAADKILEFQTDRKKLENEILDVQIEQANMLKELKDGYLDAVQAMAFGAGRFEKIIITQEKNTAKALKDNLAAENALLGVANKRRALSSDVGARRFGGQFGSMTNLQGEMLNYGDFLKDQQEITKNFADPLARAMSEAVTNTFMGFRDSMRDIGDDVAKRISGAPVGGTGVGAEALGVAAANVMEGTKGLPKGRNIDTGGGADFVGPPAPGTTRALSSSKYRNMMTQAADNLKSSLQRVGDEIDKDFNTAGTSATRPGGRASQTTPLHP